ncbi:HAD family hydrolase [Rhodovibrionaceae bacterium A322]
MSPELLIFDCDGVLIDSEVLACQAVAEELRAQGFDYSDDEVAHRFAGWTDGHIARFVSEEQGRDLTPDFATAVAARALKLFEADLEPMPGIKAFLEGWQGPICVASNSGITRLARALEMVGLEGAFPAGRQFSAELVSQPKPAPDLHRHVCTTLAVAPDKALVIEDSVTGVQGAVAAGVPVVGFLGASHLPAGQGDKLKSAGALEVFDQFAQLPELLQHLKSAAL